MFPCDKCGECCRHIDADGELLPASFDSGGGVCRHLTADGLCAIYDHRPEVCNVDLYYQNHMAGMMSREEWYKANKKACAMLRKKYSELARWTQTARP